MPLEAPVTRAVFPFNSSVPLIWFTSGPPDPCWRWTNATRLATHKLANGNVATGSAIAALSAKPAIVFILQPFRDESIPKCTVNNFVARSFDLGNRAESEPSVYRQDLLPPNREQLGEFDSGLAPGAVQCNRSGSFPSIARSPESRPILFQFEA